MGSLKGWSGLSKWHQFSEDWPLNLGCRPALHLGHQGCGFSWARFKMSWGGLRQPLWLKSTSTQQCFQVPGLRTQDSPPGEEAGKRGGGLGRGPGSAEKVPTAGSRASMPTEHWSILNGSPSFWGSHLQSQASCFQPGAGERCAASQWHASATSHFYVLKLLTFQSP